MNVGDNNVQGVLEGTKQFVVPLFQRGYSWKPKNWEMLWADIVRLYDQEEQAHFLGAIVTAPMDGLPDQTTQSSDLMFESLLPGVRKTPTTQDANAVFKGL